MRSKNRRNGIFPKPKVPRHKRGPALRAKARKNFKIGEPKPLRPIHPATRRLILKPGDKRIRFWEKGPIYLREDNSRKSPGTIHRIGYKQ